MLISHSAISSNMAQTIKETSEDLSLDVQQMGVLFSIKPAYREIIYPGKSILFPREHHGDRMMFGVIATALNSTYGIKVLAIGSGHDTTSREYAVTVKKSMVMEDNLLNAVYCIFPQIKSK